MKPFHILFIVLLLVVSIAACTPQPAAGPETTPETAVTDSAGLVEALRAAGATVEIAGVLDDPLFPTQQAQTITVNGQAVQLYDFESEATAQAAAATVSQAGTLVGESVVEWRDAPHFYRAGRFVAIYAGADESVLNALQTALGEPFLTGVGMNPS